jgi:PAS domain S-box-containing protein
VDGLLRSATEEAARLLGADGAMLYLLDPVTGRLRFTHDAGIAGLGPDSWIRSLELELGVGLFGRAVAERRVVVTGDYTADGTFVHADATDRFVREVGIRSLVVAPMAAGSEVFGALGTFAGAQDAFTAPQVGLVRALADHAALAMANARLIDELARSREAVARQAIVERSLRELGTRISGARDPEAVVQHTIDEALRLLEGDGARIDIVDPEVNLLRGLYSAGEEEILATEWPRDPDDRLEVGASGRAVVTGKTVISPDYLSDDTLVHSIGPDTYVRNKGIHGVIATPLFGDQGPFGAITVWSTRHDAFDGEHAVLLETIAGQSAVALGRARLIEELGRSREALARRAEEERSLREIGSRLAKIGEDPGDVLLRIVHETARLLGGERARLDLLEPLSGSLLWTYPAGTPFNDRIVVEELSGSGPDARPVGLAGLAVHEGRAVTSGDYLADTRFRHYAEGDRGVREVDLHSIIAAPVTGDAGLLGVLQAGHRAVGAFGEDELRLIGALAAQASIAITNARLVDRLASSQAALERTADAERALREIARRMMAIQDPSDLLQDVTDEAARLLGSSGAVIDLLDTATAEVRWAHDAGLAPAVRAEWQRRAAGSDGVLAAIRSRTVILADDYSTDERFPDGPANADFLGRAGIRSIAFAPMIGEATVLGTLAVFAPETGRFGQEDAGLLAALADLATIAIHNAELIRELGRSREETAQRAETERSLREIAARVTSVRDPETILGLIVDETRRVLGSDGAHLTRMSDDRTFLRPVVIAGGMDDETREWLRTQEFPLGGGINGLAAGQGRVVWTPEYATDPRIPRDDDDLGVAERMGLGAMAAAPLRAPGGEVIGTLAVSYRVPGPISGDRLATLQALADHAAIALSNSDLLARLEASEERYRSVIQSSPDLIWATNRSGRYVFVSDRVRDLLGWEPEEVVGRPFREFIAESSVSAANDEWARLAAEPGRTQTQRLDIRHRDGSMRAFEVSSVAVVRDGGVENVYGIARDIRERERLEADLRESEERYRYLVQSSPDLVWMTDDEGRFTFVSDQALSILGWEPAELFGRSFAELAPATGYRAAMARFRWLRRRPTEAHRSRLKVLARDGRELAMEITGIGMVAGDRFLGAHGAARDVSERDRLEQGLRRQAAELASSEERAHLARELHDSVTQALFSMTLLSRSIELLLDRDPSQVTGKLVALRELQRDALAEMRALIFELRPGNVEEHGLIQALRTHSASLSGRIGLPVVVEADLPERPSIEVEETLYRIAQEALHNVVKHAGAREVRVEVGRGPAGVRLRVSDDGRGFDPALVPDGHLGLAGMRSRAERLGGTLVVTASPGNGTVVDVVVPDATAAEGSPDANGPT